MSQLGRLDRRDAVAERLQARGLAVGDAVVHLDQRDLGDAGPLGEAARQVEPDDRPRAAQVAPLRAAERALAARQLRPRRDAVAGAEARRRRARSPDPGAELVPEELDRRLGFQPPLDAVVGQRGDALGELRLGDARLHAERFDDDVAGAATGFGHVVEPHVAEGVEPPGFHRVGLLGD